MRALIVAFLLTASQTLSAQSLLFAAKEKGKKFGYIDEKGEYKIPPSFEDAGAFYNGRAAVMKGKKYGLIDTKGELVVKAEYDKIEEYAPDGKFTVSKGGRWGIIDGDGKTIIPIKYDYLSVIKNGVVIGGRVLTGKYFKGSICPFVLSEKSDTLFLQYDCSDMPSFLTVRKEKKGFTYPHGLPLVQEGFAIFDSPDWEGEGDFQQRSLVRISNQNPFWFDGLGQLSSRISIREGRVAITYKTEGEATTGRFLDTLQLGQGYGDYQDAFELYAEGTHPFFNGVAAVEQNGKWNFVDREGWIISKTNLSTEEYRASPPMYYNGLIGLFNSEDKAGYVDIEGNVVIPFQFEEYHPFEYDVTPVKYNGLYGLLRKDGSWAAQPKFEMINFTPCPCYQ